ncbi:site-specific integrase [Stappia taiwanensis]|uniref:Site-specific integrase n=1 Tax=Stappia taiwanensis TaxID=992267 RepID=A0A838XVI4_9HYPH|nr:site-specific integrase [Stappia taiwanensis]MBA4613747.1 site-specific integrase [Stappia taiwanensis]GGE93662.1 hypothetical protein GCM10007285_21630 [Stappia taiwanensis]
MSNGKTISDACRAWLKRCELDELECATLRSYRNHVDHHIEPAIGELCLASLSRSDVRDFIDDMLDKNSRAMTDKVLRSLRSALNEALDREWVDNNVALSVKLRRSSRNAPDRVIPTKEEIKTMLRAAPTKHRPLIVTAIYTGMRMSELRGLRWVDVDFTRSIIQVRQRADRFNEIGKPKFSFHALRHAAASLFIEQGWPAKKVQTILGHASITMTFDVYGHLFDNAEDDVNLFAKLEADLEAA